MEIKRFFFQEHQLKGSPSIRGSRELRPVAEVIEEFLAGGVRVVRLDLSPTDTGDHPGVMLAIGYERASNGGEPHRPYSIRVFFERRNGPDGFKHVDDAVNAFLAEVGDADRHYATIAVGSGIQKIVIVTVVASRKYG